MSSKKRAAAPGRPGRTKPVAKPPYVTLAMISHETPLLGRAFSSGARLADRAVIIDSGIERRTKLDLSSRAVTASIDVSYVLRPWDDDFAAARNAALHAAERTGAEWALILDSDEWFQTNMNRTGLGILLRNSAPAASALMVSHQSGTYSQPRLIRLPASGRYAGRVHEAYGSPPPRPVLPRDLISFNDDPKTPAQARAKFERDLRILEQVVEKEPSQRWLYYLGQTRDCLLDCLRSEPETGKPKEVYWSEGVWAYEAAANASGWDEEGAWAAYKGACLRLRHPDRQTSDEDREAALRLALLGMRRYPATAELHWMAGYCCYYLGRYTHAAAWGESAIALGYAEGQGEGFGRILFRDPPQLYEKPYSLAAFAWERLGNSARASNLRNRAIEAEARRAAQTLTGGTP